MAKTLNSERIRQDFKLLLAPGDLRTTGNNARAVATIKSKVDFEKLFPLIFSDKRPVAMRAIDAVEKITRTRTEYLLGHEQQLMQFARTTDNKEIKWHLAQLIPRMTLLPAQLSRAFNLLNYWAGNPHESRIVRVNSLEGMYQLCRKSNSKRTMLRLRRAVDKFERSLYPSLAARARKIRRLMQKRDR